MTPISRREREVLDCVYQLGKPTAKEVMNALRDDAGYSTVRTLLGNLVRKGWLSRDEQGLKFIYIPKIERNIAAEKDWKRLLTTYFSGSPSKAVNSFLNQHDKSFSEAELEQLEKLVKSKRNELKRKQEK